MTRACKILLADPKGDAWSEFSRALQEKGHQILIANDGSRALELAILRHPDLIFFDEDCSLVSVRTFIQILRTNPRTEDIPVVVTGTVDDTERARSLHDGYLRKPFHLHDALAIVGQILRRVEAARELKPENREIQGSLKQMGLPDVLQLLGQNRRSGSLSVEKGEKNGEFWLAEGKPVNARIGSLEGEKAFFRLLTWKEGRFAFVPAAFSGEVRIHRAMEEALLEGMRQADEKASLIQRLPAPGARLKLVSPRVQFLSGNDSVTKQVISLLKEPKSLNELLDCLHALDNDVLISVGSLLDRGLISLAPVGEIAASEPLLNPAEQHALRARILNGRPASRQVIGKTVMLTDSLRAIRTFFEQMRDTVGFRVIRSPAPELLGTWARIDFPEGLAIDFCFIPNAADAQPLWRPFAAGALAAMVLECKPSSVSSISRFVQETRLPLFMVGEKELPLGLRGMKGIIPSSSDFKQGIRELFEVVLRDSA